MKIQQSTSPHNLGVYKQYRFILFSPRVRQRNFQFEQFLNITAHTYLLALNSSVDSLEIFLDKLAEALWEQGLPGSQLSDALAKGKADPENLADALLAVVEQRGAARQIVLDNFDLVRLDEKFARFFGHLAAGDPAQLQLVINSRTLDHQFWGRFVVDGQAVVIGEDTMSAVHPASIEPLDKPHVEVYGLAGGAVFVNGLPVEDWNGPLVRELFFYLVDHPLITRTEIFNTFWPYLSRDEATNVFHVTKRKVSQSLGCELTSFSGGFYRPSKEIRLSYDVTTFEALLNKVEPSESELKTAIALHRHPFLYGQDSPWIAVRREALHHSYVEALLQLARFYRTDDQPELAISYYRRARQEVPEREDICRDLMTLHMSCGQPEQAINSYRLLQETLQTRLHIQPSKPTQAAYDAIVSRK